jgi:acetyl-CoA C-acetyltransferase
VTAGNACGQSDGAAVSVVTTANRAAELLNVNGSGISLGHPVGATGGRIQATLAHSMRRRGVRYGLETMCMGGGQGLATIFEQVS